MDRRAFIAAGGATLTGVAASPVSTNAASPAAAVGPTASPERPAPVSLPRRIELSLGVASRQVEADGDVWLLARRIAADLAALSEGRIRIEPAPIPIGGIEAVMTAQTDLYLGRDSENATWHPALHVFAGLPGGLDVDAGAHEAWLLAGGGQMLWDDLGAELGVKPILASITAHTPTFYMTREQLLRDATIAAEGLMAECLAAHGAKIAPTSRTQAAAAMAAGDLDGIELSDAVSAVRLGIAATARCVTRLELPPGCETLTLGVRRSLWDRWSEADRLALERVAQHHAARSRLEELANRLPVRDAIRQRFGHIQTSVAEAEAAAIRHALFARLQDIGSFDARTARIRDSLAAFISATTDADTHVHAWQQPRAA